MKRAQIIAAIIFLMFNFLLSQTQIKENPARPLNTKSDAIRDMRLTEEQLITDEQEGFFLKRPRKILIAPNGDVIIRDEKHLYQLDAKGKFIRDLIVQGEGPGEVKHLSDYFISGDTVTIGTIYPAKIIQKNISTGELVNEFRVQKANTTTELVKVIGDLYYFTFSDLDLQKIKSGIRKQINRFMFTDSSGVINDLDLTFETISAVIKINGDHGTAIAMSDITRLLPCFDSRNHMYIANEERYLITQVDLAGQKILKQFRRKYRPVDYIKPETENEEDQSNDPTSQYKREFFNDILLMKTYQGRLHVFTSTMDPKRGILVDVFDDQGEYVDCYYLNLPNLDRHEDIYRRPITLHDGYLWTTYVDEDENPIIVKYKIDL